MEYCPGHFNPLVLSSLPPYYSLFPLLTTDTPNIELNVPL